MSAATPYTPYLPLMASLMHNEQLKLPLSREMAMLVMVVTPKLLLLIYIRRRFQALLKTYDQLAEMILHSNRIDMRCRTIHYLDAAMRHVGIFFLLIAASFTQSLCREITISTTRRESQIPILSISTLNLDNAMTSFQPHCQARSNSELMFWSHTLCLIRFRFVFVGLGHLMEHLLISNARHLRTVNAFGVKKIIRNILALQQSIKTLTNEQRNTEFERAKRYYSLFFMSTPVGPSHPA